MDDFEDIVLDDYDSFLGDKDAGNSQDPLDPLSTKSKKRTNQKDGGNDPDDIVAPLKKQRIKMKKLDHNVLLSAEGLPRLRNETPWLEFNGDNDVGENLEKLMQYYRSWAYKIYPRLNFPDFASRVLKTTGNKDCKGELTHWREEYIFKNGGDSGGNTTSSQDHTTGGLSGLTLEDAEKNSQNSDKNDSSDDDNSEKDADGNNERQQSRPSPTPPTSNIEETPHMSNADDEAWAAMMDADLDEDDGGALFLKPPVTTNPSIPSFSSSSSNNNTNNNMSIDDFFAD